MFVSRDDVFLSNPRYSSNSNHRLIEEMEGMKDYDVMD